MKPPATSENRFIIKFWATGLLVGLLIVAALATAAYVVVTVPLADVLRAEVSEPVTEAVDLASSLYGRTNP